MNKFYYFFGMLLCFFSGCTEKQLWTVYSTENCDLSSNLIRQLYVKDSSLNWVGTYGGGLFKVEKKKWIKTPLPQGGKYILSLIPDSCGGLWIGTARRGAYYLKNGHWDHFDTSSGLGDNNVWHILTDSKSNTWLCSRYKGVCRLSSDSLQCFTMKNGLPDRHVTLAVEDKKGKIWFGTARGGLCSFQDNRFNYINTHHGLRGNYIRALICDSVPRWVGTWDGGLNYFKDGRWHFFPEVKKPVVYIGYDLVGNLWVGTWGHGVYIKKKDQWEHLTSKNSGLPNDYVIDIKFGSQGSVFYATSQGVAEFRPRY